MPPDVGLKSSAGQPMYLLETELLRQENLFKQKRGGEQDGREGDYYLDESSENTLLQDLAKECWQYEESASPDTRASKATADVDNEKIFQQKIQSSAQQLVSNLVQKPLSMTQVLQQLERELPESIPLGKSSVETDILRIVDQYCLTFEEVMKNTPTTLEEP